ncbi:MAG: hypothetical protein GWP91_06260 [Rhodobacterales bacterium]|nr:hypothetical protein [Rhodobacterales bacterium]
MRIVFLSLVVGCSPPNAADSGSTGTTTGNPSTQATGPTTLRVLTWNIESLGNQGSADYDAVKTILLRIDADIVGLNEIDDVDVEDVRALAAELGYDTLFVPESNPFGDLRNALMTRLPAENGRAHQAGNLSSDGGANDLTRLPVSLNLTQLDLTLVSNHWKSGYDEPGEFRKCTDSIRTLQAANVASPTGRFILMGDVNHEATEGAQSPVEWTSLPSGTPSSFRLGQDIADQLSDGGIRNDPFALFADAGLSVVDAAQLDGRLATRPVSGRRIDYLMLSQALTGSIVQAEIYDSTD